MGNGPTMSALLGVHPKWDSHPAETKPTLERATGQGDGHAESQISLSK